MLPRIQELDRFNAVLHRILRKTKRANLALTHRLKRQELEIQRSTYSIAPRMHAVLLENRKLRIKEHQLFLFMMRFALGYVSHDELKQHLQDKLPLEELTKLYAYL